MNHPPINHSVAQLFQQDPDWPVPGRIQDPGQAHGQEQGAERLFVVEERAPVRPQWRIAMVTETYPPEINGVANTVAQAVEGLRARGHAVQLVRPRQAVLDKPGADADTSLALTRGLTIPMYQHLRMGLPCKNALIKMWTFRRPDLVHIATEGPLGWSALQAAIKLKLPVCSDFRTNFQAYSRFYGIGWLQKPIMAYLRKFHNACHASLVPTEALRQQLEGCGLKNLVVIARGVDTRLFSPVKRSAELRRQWGLAADDVAVLHVGRLAPEKNLAALVAAYRRIQQVQPRARLVVVGDGPSRDDLQLRCPDAFFAGFQSGEALAACYASSDMFVFPSLTETYGNVVPEAMASGLAVVAYNDAAAGQLIQHRQNGALANPADEAGFAMLAAEMSIQQDLRKAWGERARGHMLAHGWESVLRRVEATYAATVVQAHAPQPDFVQRWVQPGLASSSPGVEPG